MSNRRYFSIKWPGRGDEWCRRGATARAFTRDEEHVPPETARHSRDGLIYITDYAANVRVGCDCDNIDNRPSAGVWRLASSQQPETPARHPSLRIRTPSDPELLLLI